MHSDIHPSTYICMHACNPIYPIHSYIHSISSVRPSFRRSVRPSIRPSVRLFVHPTIHCWRLWGRSDNEQWRGQEVEVGEKQCLILFSLEGLKYTSWRGWIESEARTEGEKRPRIKGEARIEGETWDWAGRMGFGEPLPRNFLKIHT